MDENSVNIDRFFAIDVQLIVEDAGEAFASIELNSSLTWIKFILTDDKPNANKNRIPKEEFGNIISSGLYMPIKMTQSEIGGHANSVPIGVITHLKEKGNKVVGLAALWEAEHPEEVALLKERYAENKSLDLSWEIQYASNEFEGDIEVLRDTSLMAATFVQVPAYGGRTFVTELSEKKEDTLDNKTLEELQKEYKSNLEEKDNAIASLQEEVASLKESQITEEMTQELESLREFKQEIEAEFEKQEKLDKIAEMFEEAKLKLSEDYIEENKEQLLSMSEEALSLFVKGLAEAKKESGSASAETNVPNVTNTDSGDDEDMEKTPKGLGRLAREQKFNK